MTTEEWSVLITTAMAVLLVFSSSVFAFKDAPKGEAGDKIMKLKEMGIVSGVEEDLFNPEAPLTYAQGVTLIVNAFDLANQPAEEKSQTEFTHIQEEAWYAHAFQFAQQHGLELPKDVDPHQEMTKEGYIHYLFRGMITTGDYMFIHLYMLIADEEDVDPQYMNSIQKMLVSNIISLDEEQKLDPKAIIQRGDAAVMLYDTLMFVQEHQEHHVNLPADEPGKDTSSSEHRDHLTFSCDETSSKEEDFMSSEVTCQIEPVNDEVNKVTLSWGMQPNPGYSLSIGSIEFKNEVAYISYERHYPHPDYMYPQVIVEPTATTYVSSEYEIMLKDTTPAAAETDAPENSEASPERPSLDLIMD